MLAMAEPRMRIVHAASKILAREGRDAVTTRAVATAARVQAPTIYRLFGDKRGLLDAVVEYGLETYMQAKARHAPIADPIDDLRLGWDQYVAFGLEHPALWALMADPTLQLDAGRAGLAYLAQKIHRIALAGRLRMSERRAADLVHAAGLGTVLALLERPERERDPELSATAREAIVAAITTKSPAIKPNKTSSAAIALRAGLADLTALTPGERDLLGEWLARIEVGSHP